MEVAIIKHNKY